VLLNRFHFLRVLAAVAAGISLCSLSSCKKPATATDASGGAEAGAAKATVVEISDELEPSVPEPEPVPPLDPAIPELKVNKAAQVGILCYHDFVSTKAATQMRIHTDHFRLQMQAIKDARLPVISMTDFLKWRRGEKDIPDSCIMITIDDGYISVYTDALPIFKEFGYPFTVFLYKQYVNGGGRALTTPMIKEILANRGEVGSHSVSHPFNIARPGTRTPEEYEAFLVHELKDSKDFLEDLLMLPVPTYAHPGGTYTQHILELGTGFGYEFMFSVNPAKATWESAPGLIPRYVVLGNDVNDRNFKAALSFRGVSEGDLGRQLLGGNNSEEAPLVTVSPQSNATIAARRPLISVDVSKLEGVDPATVSMKIAGYGQVPCLYDARTGHITYQVVEPFRSNEVHVHVSLQRQGADKPDMISWKFFIDLVAHYLPEPPVTVAAPKAVQISEGEMGQPMAVENPLSQEPPAAVPPPVKPHPKPEVKKPKK
jgi:peptidoglycan/xylan/chitin deacetylase (PgdA/CDA1 family)